MGKANSTIDLVLRDVPSGHRRELNQKFSEAGYGYRDHNDEDWLMIYFKYASKVH
jgi:hypothetical protein